MMAITLERMLYLAGNHLRECNISFVPKRSWKNLLIFSFSLTFE